MVYHRRKRRRSDGIDPMMRRKGVNDGAKISLNCFFRAFLLSSCEVPVVPSRCFLNGLLFWTVLIRFTTACDVGRPIVDLGFHSFIFSSFLLRVFSCSCLFILCVLLCLLFVYQNLLLPPYFFVHSDPFVVRIDIASWSNCC